MRTINTARSFLSFQKYGTVVDLEYTHIIDKHLQKEGIYRIHNNI